jgi:hypothetical protein
MARHTLAAGGRRAVGNFHFRFAVFISPLCFSRFRFRLLKP